ncbi:MAG: sigma-70 family RNA polymerase sigma factor [Xanthomonadales bacterium]|nr:sigma-70 family RNA polymerase sigma factor [Xanthomonadales bacterium]
MSGPIGDLQNTTALLKRYQGGDSGARDQLINRYLPILRRWARGRLPRYGRDLSETDDLVQVTFIRALNNLERFESTRPGAFLAYLRTILLNNVREELRKSGRQPHKEEYSDASPGESPGSVVEQVIGAELVEEYEEALEKLRPEEREPVIMRVEFGMTYPEIAAELGSPSANAVRMTISRALAKLAKVMGNE